MLLYSVFIDLSTLFLESVSSYFAGCPDSLESAELGWLKIGKEFEEIVESKVEIAESVVVQALVKVELEQSHIKGEGL